ncbi:uncharacterized protein LOC143768166 [Ranitomeya variabilis]|uniref:uncharacterized protein LOC143768166 n=1 Tax=Ranitomeya variabilis TaxID=490064 RepID=UPI004056701E
MDREWDKMAERILHLTLEILLQLTGEDYTVVKKTSSERCQAPVSEGWGRPLSPITGSPPHPLIHEDINDQKILELTYKMIELLTGEVPIRCQDVTVYFSMEEWEYLEGHKDLYKDVMMEVPQPLTSPVLSSKRTTPERCPRPLLPQDCKQENPNVPQDHQGEELTHINTTETYVRGDERCKEEISIDGYTDDCTKTAEAHLKVSDSKEDDCGNTQDLYKEQDIIQNITPTLHCKSLLCDPFQQFLYSDSSRTIMYKKNYRRNVKHHTAHTAEKKSCSECGKCFREKRYLVTHARIHTGEKPFSCSECRKCFNQKSALVRHQKIHTGDKPFSCSECGKCFIQTSDLVKHLRTHTSKKPFSCSECGNCFNQKSTLVRHQKIHTGEKPYPCPECGKCFIQTSDLVKHLRTHTGKKPFSCSECGNCFKQKSALVRHQKIHTGETPYTCPECGKCFSIQSKLVRHQKIHREKWFSLSDPLSGDLLYKRIFLSDPTRMERDRDKMAERILHLTLEILFRLTGEDYTVVKKTSSERCQAPVSEVWGRPLSPITGPPPHPLIHDDINDQKILELTYKMIELLTGEVPIRCQDVTVYFSMEEWEYLEGHKDLYEEIMMEVPQPLTSPVLSSKRTTPERCPRPLLPQDCKQEHPNVPQDHQGEYLPHINTTETYVRGDEQCKEEIPTDYSIDDCTRSSEGHLIFSDIKEENRDIPPNTYEEQVPVISPNLSSDTFQQVLSSVSLKNKMQNKNNMRDSEQQKCYTVEKPFSCPECGKCFNEKLNLLMHQKIHTEEKPFSCSECGKCYSLKSRLKRHQKRHSGVKPYSCPECGKCFIEKSNLATHERIHTGEKPFFCLECGKCFTHKSDHLRHLITHTGEKPFSCSECGKCYTIKSRLARHLRIHTAGNPFSCAACGKCFTEKSNLVTHERIHTGEKPFSCSECGKCFTDKSQLARHQKNHTGEKPFSCSYCGKCFTEKSPLVRHQKSHTGEKPFSCSQCGKCFTEKSYLVRHQRSHTGEKLFSCLECGKWFTQKSILVRHQRIHTGEKPFSCSECEKSFNQRSSFLRHQRIHYK